MKLDKVVLPLDLQEKDAAAAILKKAQEHLADHTQLHLVTVMHGFSVPLIAGYFPDDAVAKALGEMNTELQRLAQENLDANVSWSTEALCGTPHKEIVKKANQLGADIIIMPKSNHSMAEAFFVGSVTSKVVEQSKCPVLVLK